MEPFVISHGGGVQTCAMVQYGIDHNWPIQAVVYADTQDDPPWTYEAVRHTEALCKQAGIPFAVVQGEDGLPMLDWYERSKTIPFITKRSCTDHFKIRPVRAWMTAQGMRPVNVAIGYTLDEVHRVKDSNVQWATNVFPLIEELHWDAGDCMEYLCGSWDGEWQESLDPKEPGVFWPVLKSGCMGCPMQGRKGYQILHGRDPAEFDRWLHLEQNGRNYGTKKHHTLLPNGPSLAVLKKRYESETTLLAFDDSDVEGLCDEGGCFT